MANPPKPTETDADLAARVARRRDAAEARKAFLELHTRHSPKVLAYLAARSTPAEASTAAVAVWARIWEALGDPQQFDGQDFLTLAFQVAREHAAGLPGDPTQATRREALARGLDGLPPGERAVVEARLVGSTLAEIAARAKADPDRAAKVFAVAASKLNASLEPSAS